MKEQIQQLIAAGQTKEALHMLAQFNSDALLLMAQYNNGEKQFNLGLIDFGEWGRVTARVNMAALEMAGGAAKPSGTPEPKAPGQAPASHPMPAETVKKVFISYSRKDKEEAQKVYHFLQKAGCAVTIDEENTQAADSLSGFVQEAIRNNQFILSIISRNSLLSGWVGKEVSASLIAEWLTNKQKLFIPVQLDDAFLDPAFFIEALETIETDVKSTNEYINKAQGLGAKLGPLNEKLRKLYDLKNNLPDILEKLHDTLTVDISGDGFEKGMGKVLERIQTT